LASPIEANPGETPYPERPPEDNYGNVRGFLDRTMEDAWLINSVNFYSELGTLILDVGDQDLARSLVEKTKLEELIKNGFKPKDEIHITVLNYDNGKRILESLEQLSDQKREDLLQTIERTATNLDWTWRSSGKLYPFRRPGRDGGNLKLVTLVDCPRVVDFYNWIDHLLPDAQLVRHPMHVTLLKRPMDLSGHPDAKISGLTVGRPLDSLGHLALGY
jgi:hypothetical protein